MVNKDRAVIVRKMPSAMHKHLKAIANGRSDGNCSKEMTSFIDGMIQTLSPLALGVDGKEVGYFSVANIGIGQKRRMVALAKCIGVSYGDLIKVFYHIERLLPEAKRAQNQSSNL